VKIIKIDISDTIRQLYVKIYKTANGYHYAPLVCEDRIFQKGENIMKYEAPVAVVVNFENDYVVAGEY